MLHELYGIVANGDCDVVLGSKNTAYAVVPVSTKLSDLTYSLVSRDSLVAPIKAGQKMTEVDIWLNDDCVAEAELYAMNDVSVQELSAQMGISLPKAYELVKEPGFPTIRIGARILIPIEAYKEWLVRSSLNK